MNLGCRFDTSAAKRRYGEFPHTSMALKPGTISLRQFEPPQGPFDQNGASCEGHRAAAGIYVVETAQGKRSPVLYSPDTIYRLARCHERNSDAIPLEDTGCMTSSVILALGTDGVVPYRGPLPSGQATDVDPSAITREPHLTELVQASGRLVVGEYAIPKAGALLGVQAALGQGFPVWLDVWADDALQRWTPGAGPLGVCNLADPNGGGHAVLCVGMTVGADLGVALDVLNSWGRGYGDAGHFQADETWFNLSVDGIVVGKVGK
jgi:hypothetical protein